MKDGLEENLDDFPKNQDEDLKASLGIDGYRNGR